MSDADRAPVDVDDVLEEDDPGPLREEIAWMERVAMQNGDALDFRAGAMSVTKHLRREFALDEKNSPRIVDEDQIGEVAGHLQEALAHAEDSETRYRIREASQLLFAMVQEAP
jgi:hypothetical protein